MIFESELIDFKIRKKVVFIYFSPIKIFEFGIFIVHIHREIQYQYYRLILFSIRIYQTYLTVLLSEIFPYYNNNMIRIIVLK